MTTLVQTKVDNKVKVGAERALKSMGMSLEEGIRIFLSQVMMEKALPFQPFVVEEPNEETMRAIERVDRGEGLIRVTLKEFEEMLDEKE